MKLRSLMAAGLVLLTTSVTFGEAPKREMRSVWVAGMGIDWPKTSGTTATAQAKAKKEMTDYLDKFKAQNFTGICLHVRPRADAYYKSTLEPWSGDVSGKRGTDPGWDPLEFVIEECHKRGMECYAWINPYRVNANALTYTTPFDNQWRNDGWIFVNGKWTVFNPGLPAARKHCLDVMKEIYDNYAIDGMLFDDYFYPGDHMPSGANESQGADYELYLSTGTSLSLGDWRRQNVNTFVKELYDDIQKTRPDMRFGIGPAGVSRKSASRYGLPEPNISSGDWMYDGIFCDPLAWMEDKSIDFIAPQIYWARTHSTAPYGPLAKWWSDVADHFGIHNYISIASYKVNTTEFGGSIENGSKEIGKQVELAREYTLNNAPGAIYYNASSINGPSINGLGDYLGANQYSRPALVPVVDWKKRVNYAPVGNLTNTNGVLSWTAAAGKGQAIIRYTVYAIPSTVTLEQAKASDGDGLSGDYLLDVSYATSYTLPQEYRAGYWYAVCVYDGYGYESDCSVVGYSTEPSASVTLIAPQNGTTVGWDVDFKWSSLANATYSLQIAYDSEFMDLFYDGKPTTETSVTVAMDGLPENTQLYWRVASSEPGKLAGYSEVRRFFSPKLSTASTPNLVTPENGAKFDDLEVPLSWTMASTAGVDKLTLEVTAHGKGFDKPLFTQELAPTATSFALPTASVGEGSFDWRVSASGTRVRPAVSATRNFVIADLKIGAYEHGYTVKTDPAAYDKVDNITIQSLWYRSVHSPFNNYSFESDGLLNRGMTATSTHVYVSARSESSANADIFLKEYSAMTGEHIRDIALNESGRIPYYPCNDVIKDTEGNICISNLSLNVAATPIIIHRVDLATGELTKVAELTASAGGRVDHVGLYGDVTTGDFFVFAAVSNNSVVYRWKITDGKSGDPVSRAYSIFYPDGAPHFGVAPKIYPVSENLFYVDGGSTAWTLYNFTTGTTMVGSFANASGLAPRHNGDNGAATFTLGGKEYGVYSVESANSYITSRFSVVKMGDKQDFSEMSRLWEIPRDGLGTIASSTASAPVAAVNIDDRTAQVYIYNSGNGLAAYRISDTSSGDVEDITVSVADRLDVTISGLTVFVNGIASEIRAYSPSGSLVAVARDSRFIDLPCSGSYIINADGVSTVVYVR